MAAVTVSTTTRIGSAGNWMAKCLFAKGTDLYLVVQDTGATPKVRVLKSTDAGATWTEQDSANNKAVTTATSAYSACLAGGVIYVVYGTGANTLTVAKFDTATDLWTTSVPGNPSTTAQRDTYSVRVAVRSDGDVLVGVENASSVLVIARYEGASWASDTMQSGALARPQELVVDSQDIATLFWAESTVNDHSLNTLSAANAVGTAQDIDATTGSSSSFQIKSLNAEVYDAGGTDTVLCAYIDATNELDGVPVSLENAAPTIGAIAAISATTTTNPVLQGSATTLKSPVNGDLLALWTQTGATVINHNRFTGGAWGSDTNWKTGLSANSFVVQAITHPSGVAVVYHDGTSVMFDWFETVTATASGRAPVWVGW